MGEGFAWTIPLIQAGFAILFAAACRAGAPAEARLWAIGYALNAAAFAVSLLDPFVPGRTVALATDVLFAAAFFHFGGALAQRYGVRTLATARRMMFVLAAAAPMAGILLAGSVRIELLGSDLGCALQLCLPLLFARRVAGGIDRGVIALSWMVVAANVVRPLSIPFTAADATFASFAATAYSYVMYADGMVTGIAAGILALLAVATDLVTGYRHEACVDPLTGLLNRRGLDASTSGHARADGAVVCCDLDHFKRVNDTCGHDVGDRVLVAFADLARSALPPGGLAARVGGEEFLLYLPGGSLADAQTTAMRLRAAMARHDWSAQAVGWRLSASFGVAARRPDHADLADTIRAADTQLYEAKRNGRDQVWGLAAA